MFDAFDLAHGTETAAIERLLWTRLFHGGRSECSRYQAIDPVWFRDAVSNVPRWPFIDLGSGKGRPLILAHEAGFTHLTGVDFSRSLCRIARRNLKRCKIKAEVINADATEFAFPHYPTVVFMYNPFGPEIMQKVLDNLGTSPRVLVYVNPEHRSLFQRFRLVENLGHSHIYMTYGKKDASTKLGETELVTVPSVAGKPVVPPL